MSGPTGAVKSCSVPGFTLTPDMPSMGEAPEAEKATARTADDGFEAAKAAAAEPMAQAQGGNQVPPALRAPLAFLQAAHQFLQHAAQTWWEPFASMARVTDDALRPVLDNLHELIRTGQQITQAVIDGVNQFIDWLRGLPVVGPLLPGGN